MKKTIIIAVLAVAAVTAVFVFSQKASPTMEKPQAGINGNANTVVNRAKKVDLSNKSLKKIPDFIFDRIDIEELDVSNNQLSGAIQSQIGRLVDLKVLDASDNQMTGVPAEIGRLRNLEVLDLSNNKLTGLPNELGNLQNLKTLNLSGNSYSQQDLDGIRAKLPASVNIILK